MQELPSRRGKLKIIVFFLYLALLYISAIDSKTSDYEALLELKASVDVQNLLPWRSGTANDLCSNWTGIRACTPNGRVTKLVLEFLNLTGNISEEVLAPLDQLRVLSLKSNALSGPIPDLSTLRNLKILYLSNNQFSGRIPATLAVLHRLTVFVLSGNRLSGSIPAEIAGLPRLYTVFLQDNRLSGSIPPFNQSSLRFFNVSGNELSGEIPATKALLQFNESSFLGNPRLCGPQINVQCPNNPSFALSPSPNPPPRVSTSTGRRRRRKIAIIAGSIAGGVLLVFLLGLLVFVILKRKQRRVVENRPVGAPSEGPKDTEEAVASGSGGGGGGTKGGGFSWEAEGIGKLVFCSGVGEMYSLEELLRASAETLGRGTVGSTYKAVMESGFIVTVKRLRDTAAPGADEFRRKMEELGRLRHPNLVPVRAYFQAKEERLMVYDYFPNGSLYSLIHGSRPSGRGKPLHWTSCLKIAEDVAAGLLYLHQADPPTAHANLKSSNVLLGPDFESCLTDYALIPSFSSNSSTTEHHVTSSSSLFYRAPECRSPLSSSFTPQSDVYSFGVLLLELLTGKTPFQDLVEEHGADIPRWVRSVREDEKTDSSDEPGSSGNEASGEKLTALMNIAMACVAVEAERRPSMNEVLRMVREARAEVMVSSNSSDHSPGRWSDTVQSLPKEHGSENSTERD